MSDPIDFIDLTADSPVYNTLRSYNRNVDNTPNNSTNRKLQKHTLSKRQLLQTSVIEVTCETAYKTRESMEIIDLDNINSSEEIEKVHGINDSTEENVVALVCPICFEQLTSGMKPMSTRCGHIFCNQCLELCLRRLKKCPKCKKAVTLKSCTRLYF